MNTFVSIVLDIRTGKLSGVGGNVLSHGAQVLSVRQSHVTINIQPFITLSNVTISVHSFITYQ